MADDNGITDASSTDNLFGSIINDAFQFATPFAQRLLGSSSTPANIHAGVLRDAALNGSGPNDASLSNQAPRGLLDFITGARVSGGGGGTSSAGSGPNWTVIGIALVALVIVVMMLKK